MKKQNIVKKFFALAAAAAMTLSLCSCAGTGGDTLFKTFPL